MTGDKWHVIHYRFVISLFFFFCFCSDFLDFLCIGALRAHLERFSVSNMQEFLIICVIFLYNIFPPGNFRIFSNKVFFLYFVLFKFSALSVFLLLYFCIFWYLFVSISYTFLLVSFFFVFRFVNYFCIPHNQFRYFWKSPSDLISTLDYLWGIWIFRRILVY